MRAGRHTSVEVSPHLEDFLTEKLRLGHVGEGVGFIADIVADKLEDHEERVVFQLVTTEGSDVTETVLRVSAVHTEVLVVVAVATVRFQQVFVERVHLRIGEFVTSRGALVREIEGVGDAIDYIIERFV